MKTSELTGAALDWAVCVAKGCTYTIDVWLYEYKHLEGPRYSTDWSRGGPMIEREWIDLHCVNDSLWEAECPAVGGLAMQNGPTPLTAAMRCYVASKLGHDVDVPEELCQPSA